MAIVVESTASNVDYTSGASVTITKPTGLAEGDLMIAVCEGYGASGVVVDTASGWTSAIAPNLTLMCSKIQTKIADASDVAASDFTFTGSGAVYSMLAGTVMRVTGVPPSSFVDATDSDSDGSASSATISFTTTASPSNDGFLIISSFGAAATANTGTIGSYVASDGTLSWTELHDYTEDVASEDPIIGAAYAIQTTATALTSYGATLSTSKTLHVGALAVFQAIRNETGTNTLLSVSPTSFTQNGSAGTTGTNTLVEVSPTHLSQSGSATTPTQWSNESKPSTSWTNET